MSDRTAHPHLPLSQETRISLPLIALLGLLSAVALGYAAFTTLREQTTRNTDDIVQLKRQQQENREILIRIDENVKQLKAQP